MGYKQSQNGENLNITEFVFYIGLESFMITDGLKGGFLSRYMSQIASQPPSQTLVYSDEEKKMPSIGNNNI